VPDLVALHGEVLAQVDRLLAIAEDPGDFPAAQTDVSGWSPLLHAEHMSKADAASLHQLEAALERGSKGEAGPRINLAGRAVLALGWIPRGVGKAPAPSRPVEADRGEVAEALRAVRGRIDALRGRWDEIAGSRGRASHPIFGGLDPPQWLRFLWIHHHHHLKIVRDIEKAWRG
jgi:hypothetical protein